MPTARKSVRISALKLESECYIYVFDLPDSSPLTSDWSYKTKAGAIATAKIHATKLGIVDFTIDRKDYSQ